MKIILFFLIFLFVFLVGYAIIKEIEKRRKLHSYKPSEKSTNVTYSARADVRVAKVATIAGAANTYTASVKTEKTERLHVAGVSYHLDAIMELAIDNDEYEESKKDLCDDHDGEDFFKVYQYFFDPIKVNIEPEPDNPADPNALKVIVDGNHVGYIKKGSIPHVKKMLSGDKIISMKAIIGGGKYREFWLNEETDKWETSRGETPYSVTIEIKSKI